MKVKIYSQDGKVKGEMDLSDQVFATEIDEHLLYLVIKSLRANKRQGTSKTKTRAEVSGGGKKPWKQKHTGNARAGSNTSPLWVRGGKAHGPHPRDYFSHIPKAQRIGALRGALSSSAKEGKIIVIDRIGAEVPKTKVIVSMLTALSVADKKNLLIIDPADRNVFLSGRNVKNLHIRPVGEINALDVVSNDHIIFGEQGLVKKVEEAVTR